MKITGKLIRGNALLKPLGLLFFVGTLLAALLLASGVAQDDESGCAVHLHDGDNAKDMTFTNIRNVGYGEISLICGSGPGNASMYNTLGLNNENQTKPPNSNPPALWNNISEDAVAEEYNVPSAWKNGPRFWTVDSITLP
jgi:hypothetical protein